MNQRSANNGRQWDNVSLSTPDLTEDDSDLDDILITNQKVLADEKRVLPHLSASLPSLRAFPLAKSLSLQLPLAPNMQLIPPSNGKEGHPIVLIDKRARIRQRLHGDAATSRKRSRRKPVFVDDDEVDLPVPTEYEEGPGSYVEGPTREVYQLTHRKHLHSSFEMLYGGVNMDEDFAEVGQSTLQRSRSQPPLGRVRPEDANQVHQTSVVLSRNGKSARHRLSSSSMSSDDMEMLSDAEVAVVEKTNSRSAKHASNLEWHERNHRHMMASEREERFLRLNLEWHERNHRNLMASEREERFLRLSSLSKAIPRPTRHTEVPRQNRSKNPRVVEKPHADDTPTRTVNPPWNFQQHSAPTESVFSLIYPTEQKPVVPPRSVAHQKPRPVGPSLSSPSEPVQRIFGTQLMNNKATMRETIVPTSQLMSQSAPRLHSTDSRVAPPAFSFSPPPPQPSQPSGGVHNVHSAFKNPPPIPHRDLGISNMKIRLPLYSADFHRPLHRDPRLKSAIKGNIAMSPPSRVERNVVPPVRHHTLPISNGFHRQVREETPGRTATIIPKRTPGETVHIVVKGDKPTSGVWTRSFKLPGRVATTLPTKATYDSPVSQSAKNGSSYSGNLQTSRFPNQNDTSEWDNDTRPTFLKTSMRKPTVLDRGSRPSYPQPRSQQQNRFNGSSSKTFGVRFAGLSINDNMADVSNSRSKLEDDFGFTTPVVVQSQVKHTDNGFRTRGADLRRPVFIKK